MDVFLVTLGTFYDYQGRRYWGTAREFIFTQYMCSSRQTSKPKKKRGTSLGKFGKLWMEEGINTHLGKIRRVCTVWVKTCSSNWRNYNGSLARTLGQLLSSSLPLCLSESLLSHFALINLATVAWNSSYVEVSAVLFLWQ